MMSWLTGASKAEAVPQPEPQDGRGAPVVKAAPSQPWTATFNPIAAEQVEALRTDASVSAELRGANMQVVYRTWTDIKRAKNSSLGSNITDGQFFAIAPERERAGKDYKSLPNSQYVCFPAVRPPNYTDEVDIETPENVSFKAKNRDGETETVSLAQFLKGIGRFISDLPRETDWSDGADTQPMQSASQFSVLPCPADRTEIGVAMFGYQCKNLHVVICPDGTIGWAPEGRGSKRIFLRNPDDHAELRAVALVPEDRAEVQAGFFKPEEPDETIEQEAERYKEVENQLLHIQIEMELPRSHRPAALSGFQPASMACDDMPMCYGGASANQPYYAASMSKSFGDLTVSQSLTETCGFGGLTDAPRRAVPRLGASRTRTCSMSTKPNSVAPKPASSLASLTAMFNSVSETAAAPSPAAAAPAAAAAAAAPPPLVSTAEKYSSGGFEDGDDDSMPEPEPCMDGAGRDDDDSVDSVGDLVAVEGDESACAEHDLNLARVQLGSTIGATAEDDRVPDGAKRAPGVSVRITRMLYGVASDGAITAPRVRRFIKQMSFDRRARGLAHGSLVTGEGTWSDSGQAAPITLPPLPSSIEALSQLFVQFPTKDVHKFVTGGPDAAIKLAAGEEMCVPGVMTIKNLSGTVVVTRAGVVGAAA